MLHIVVYTTLNILYFGKGNSRSNSEAQKILSINFSPKSKKSPENTLPDNEAGKNSTEERVNNSPQQKNLPLVTEQESTFNLPQNEEIKESPNTTQTSEEHKEEKLPPSQNISSDTGIKAKEDQANSNEKRPDTPAEKSKEQQEPTSVVIQNVEYLFWKKPDYPRISRRLKQEGIVYLQVTIDKEGLPVQIQTHKSSGFRPLDNSAKKAVKKWKFKPYTVGKQATRAMAIIPIEFKLEE